MREFRVERILAKEFRVIARTGATVAILVLDRDEGFVKERVALTPNLHPRRTVFPVFAASRLSSQDSNLLTTGRGINTDDLLVSAKFLDRNSQRDKVKVETTLRILCRGLAQTAAQFRRSNTARTSAKKPSSRWPAKDM